MTREEALNTWLPVVEMALVDANIPEAKEALDMAIKALEREPCYDCISRQYLIDKAVSWDKHFADGIRYVALTDILNAPPVTPQPKMGHWILKSFDPDTGISNTRWCSECDTPFVGIYKNYCPNCGAKMEVEE